MSSSDVKKIARFVASQKNVDNQTKKFILENLSRKDLARFTRILERLVSEKRVKVLSATPLDSIFKKQIEKKFDDMNIIYEIDKSIGTGIKLIVNDTIIDLSLQSFLNNAIENLKS